MKTINNINYYTKQEIADKLGCAFATISVRVSKLGLQGYYLGKCKHFTDEQIKNIAEYRAPRTEAKNTLKK